MAFWVGSYYKQLLSQKKQNYPSTIKEESDVDESHDVTTEYYHRNKVAS